MSEYILEMKGICKSFPGVKALDNVTFAVKAGEVRALVGENGAGKSTLMKVMNGVYLPEKGEIVVDGKAVSLSNPIDAKNNGLNIIFQEFNLIEELSVAENIFLGKLNKTSFGNKKLINWNNIYSESKKLINRLGYDIDVRSCVGELSVAEKQMVEIAKALSYDSRVLVMDEPTASLTANEVRHLFNIVKELKEQNVTIIFISHHLEEVFEIADNITVLRDGAVIDTLVTAETSRQKIIELMVGRSIENEFPQKDSQTGDEDVLTVENLCAGNLLKNISFSLKKGEILGIAGLVGSGRTELARAIFGADKYDSGKICVKGKQIPGHSVKHAMKNGIGLLTEDRKHQGLFLSMTIEDNIIITSFKQVSTNGILSNKKITDVSEQFSKDLLIKTPSVKQMAINLSGGNQQKVVIAKWLFLNSDIFIFDEPTRGIDVGAKYEIYELMNSLVSKGKSIIMISSELPEVLSMSDRIIVMYNGKIKGQFKKGELTPEKVIELSVVSEEGDCNAI